MGRRRPLRQWWTGPGRGQPAALSAGAAAPDPVPQGELMRSLRRAWGRRLGLPATRLMAEVGAFALRTDTELLLKSRRVVPGRLLTAGFSFAHPTWDAAAADLVARARELRRRQPVPR